MHRTTISPLRPAWVTAKAIPAQSIAFLGQGFSNKAVQEQYTYTATLINLVMLACKQGPMVDTFYPANTLPACPLPQGVRSSPALALSGKSKYENHTSRDYTASGV